MNSLKQKALQVSDFESHEAVNLFVEKCIDIWSKYTLGFNW